MDVVGGGGGGGGGRGGERRVERERPRAVERGLVDAPPAYGDVKRG